MWRPLVHITLLVGLACYASAETYQGIGPLDTLADLKSRFPNATFEALKPAWAQPEDVLYKITGRGMSGMIVVKFGDLRPYLRELAESEKNEEDKAFYRKLGDSPDDSMFLVWVRWIPEAPIPLSRFISKYGAFQHKGFSDEDLQPYRSWARGLTAYLTDDEKSAERVDFEFTIDDRCRAWRQKHTPMSPAMRKRCDATERRSPNRK